MGRQMVNNGLDNQPLSVLASRPWLLRVAREANLIQIYGDTPWKINMEPENDGLVQMIFDF